MTVGCSDAASFDPRPRMGGDGPAGPPGCPADCFDPRPRMGGDSFMTCLSRLDVDCFDPRPRMGGDSTTGFTNTGISPFRSTPPDGGRRHGAGGQGCDRRFDPRPRMGGDAPAPTPQLGCGCFDPRPRMGGDDRPRSRGLGRRGFDPRPRMGGDSRRPCDIPLWDVSIHAPGWGATAPQYAIEKANKSCPKLRIALRGWRRARFEWMVVGNKTRLQAFSSVANRPVKMRPLGVRYTISVPSGSAEGLAPTCSTRRRHSRPNT